MFGIAGRFNDRIATRRVSVCAISDVQNLQCLQVCESYAPPETSMITTSKATYLVGCSLLSAALATACNASMGSPSGTADANHQPGTPDAAPGSPDAHHQPGTPDAHETPHADAHPAENITGIPLSTQDGTQYVISLTVGAQPFNLSIDTGSTVAGVAAAGCTSCSQAGVTSLYTPGNTATDDHKTDQASYADGSGWSGEIYTDNVTAGHGTGTTQLNFVAISTQNQFFQDGSTSGILGLGPDGLLDEGTTSYFDTVTNAGAAQVLAFELCADDGQMWIGSDFDTSVASQAVQYTADVGNNNNPFYAVNLTDIGVGGTSIGVSASVYADPIVDTGTSLFYLPTSAYNALVSAIDNSQGFKSMFGSSTIAAADQGCLLAPSGTTDAAIDAALPAMSMTFPKKTGGGSFSVSVPASKAYMLYAGGGYYCFSAADGGSGSQGIGTVLGDTILRAFLTVVDVGNNQIGFAPDTGCSPANFRSRDDVLHVPTEHGHPRHHADVVRALRARHASK